MYIKHLEQTRHLVSATDIFAVQVQGWMMEEQEKLVFHKG